MIPGLLRFARNDEAVMIPGLLRFARDDEEVSSMTKQSGAAAWSLDRFAPLAMTR
jgi:hypothetical protein